jgi:hypothetical protein
MTAFARARATSTLAPVRAVLIACFLAACGNPAKYETWTEFESEDNGYRVRLLAPPWRIADEVRGVARFDVPPNQEVDSSIIPAKYLLAVDVVRGDPASLARAAERTATTRGDEIVVPVREIRSASGVEGSDLVSRRADLRYLRVTFFAHPRGALRFALESNPNPDNREMRALYESVEVE